MRKKNYTGADRKKMEEQGQLDIFSMLESGEDINKVVSKADAELEELKENASEIPDNPIGLKTEGMNMDITDGLEDYISPSEMKAMLESEEEVSEPAIEDPEVEAAELKDSLREDFPEIDDHISDSELTAMLSETVNESFDKKEEKELEISEPVDYTNYTLDEFAGSEPDYDDRLIAFDTSLPTDDPKFVTAALKNDYDSIADFKADFAGQGGLNEHAVIAFPLKADREPEAVVAMYEKKMASAQKADIKDADKEAKRIAALEASGEASEDLADSEVEPEQPKKRGRKPKR